MIVPMLGSALILGLVGDAITSADWSVQDAATILDGDNLMGKHVQEYLLHPDRVDLEIVLLIQGTTYMAKVWQALLAIPVGQYRTYSELALDLESGPRAIAQACRANPYAGIIPCHRVVAKSGIGGFAGQRQGAFVELKRRLLDYENRISIARS